MTEWFEKVGYSADIAAQEQRLRHSRAHARGVVIRTLPPRQ